MIKSHRGLLYKNVLNISNDGVNPNQYKKEISLGKVTYNVNNLKSVSTMILIKNC